jgi:hypothetical protein
MEQHLLAVLLFPVILLATRVPQQTALARRVTQGASLTKERRKCQQGALLFLARQLGTPEPQGLVLVPRGTQVLSLTSVQGLEAVQPFHAPTLLTPVPLLLALVLWATLVSCHIRVLRREVHQLAAHLFHALLLCTQATLLTAVVRMGILVKLSTKTELQRDVKEYRVIFPDTLVLQALAAALWVSLASSRMFKMLPLAVQLSPALR